MSRADIAIRAAAAFAIACFAFFLFHRIFIAPRQAREAVATAKLQAEMAKGDAAAAKEAIGTAVRIERKKVIVDRITLENDRDIKEAPGADLRLPHLKSALDRALCLRDAYKSEPDCAAMPGAGGSLQAPGPDAGGSAAE